MNNTEQMYLDFHAHILPGVDHGSSSLETSLQQLEAAREAGIGMIVATSHFYPHLHQVEEFLSLRDRQFQLLEPHLADYGITVLKGAEVQLCIGLDKMQNLEKLCIEGTDLLLLEIPDMPMTAEMFETIERIHKRMRVLIAHVNRYPKKTVQKLLDRKYMLQLNAEAFTPLLLEQNIRQILESGLVYALGSDVHGSGKRAYRSLKKAIRRLGVQNDVIQQRMKGLLQ